MAAEGAGGGWSFSVGSNWPRRLLYYCGQEIGSAHSLTLLHKLYMNRNYFSGAAPKI